MTDDDSNNIIRLPTREEREARQKAVAERDAASAPPSAPPLINLPPVTKGMLGLMLLIHVIITYALSPEWRETIFINFGFIPARFTAGGAFTPLALVTPITHMFLHGGWLHIAMNGAMLMAFGAGLERWIGARRMLLIFFISGLAGAALQFALSPASPVPMIGASGGLSGFFAAVIVLMNKRRGDVGHPRYGLWPMIILWIVVTIVFGMMGAPDGSMVAWGAHVGGFIGGLITLKALRL